MIRMRHDERTREYVERRQQEGKRKEEIMRCLKRAVAREAYRALTDQQEMSTAGERKELKALRNAKNITQSQAAEALDTYPARISDIENQCRPLPELTLRYSQWLEAA